MFFDRSYVNCRGMRSQLLQKLSCLTGNVMRQLSGFPKDLINIEMACFCLSLLGFKCHHLGAKQIFNCFPATHEMCFIATDEQFSGSGTCIIV